MVDFLLRFENWRRWCVARGLHQGHAYSIEGRYRSPQHWNPPEPKPQMIDDNDALMVNRAYTRLAQIAESQAKIIKILTFRVHLRPQWQAQKLGIHYLVLDEAYYRAKLALKNNVAFLEKVAYKEEASRKQITVQAVPPLSPEVEATPEESHQAP